MHSAPSSVVTSHRPLCFLSLEHPHALPSSMGLDLGPLGSPMGGVASVCRPTSWPGPSPSRKSLNWLSAPSRVVGKMNLCQGEQRDSWSLGWPGCSGIPSSCCPAVPYVPSELLLLVLPSVDSRLPCRVILVLISTAMPVSVLLRMLLRSFLGPPSGIKTGMSLGSAGCTQTLPHQSRHKNQSAVYGQSIPVCCSLELLTAAPETPSMCAHVPVPMGMSTLSATSRHSPNTDVSLSPAVTLSSLQHVPRGGRWQEEECGTSIPPGITGSPVPAV